jgi:hypothetical protein
MVLHPVIPKRDEERLSETNLSAELARDFLLK